ncbi:MAG: Asp-tRNA(Asn)/Glu-tRNA(Gln) amidotransferase subunit GatB [Nitrospirota bacterium]
MDYETVIGLEVHAQLMTGSKIFCSCSTKFGRSPNSQTCPICLGMPGVLPVLNKKVAEFAIRTAFALKCNIAPYSIFARKNYFYPDLPKDYQISQYELPFAKDGYIEIVVDGRIKRIGITRVHIEEDAGKNLHEGIDNASHIDFNRTGVPLLEIVSEPDIRSAEEASAYLKKLRDILVYIEVCNGNMEEGSFRCDSNLSVRTMGDEKLGTKTELKNINSFKFIQKAIEYEEKRQIGILEDKGKVVHETRLWDSERGITISMRSKEDAHDYRYFPEPDLMPLSTDQEWIEKVRASLPELPDAKRVRFITEYNLPEYDAEILTSSRGLADYFEECVKLFRQPKKVSNWIMGDLLRELKNDNQEIEESPLRPEHLCGMLRLVEENIISGKLAKIVFEEMYKTGKDAETIVEEKGLRQISDEGEITRIIENVLSSNKKQIDAYKQGKTKLFGFFIGEVMKLSKGKANPARVNELLRKRLN